MMLYDKEFIKLVGDIKECFKNNQMERVSEVISTFDKERYWEYEQVERDEIKEHEEDTNKWLDNGGW